MSIEISVRLFGYCLIGGCEIFPQNTLKITNYNSLKNQGVISFNLRRTL